MKGKYAGVKKSVIQSAPRDQAYMSIWARRHLIVTTALCLAAKVEFATLRHRRPGNPHTTESTVKVVQHEQVDWGFSSCWPYTCYSGRFEYS